MKLFLSMFVMLFWTACVSIPYRGITVVDEHGKPIRGAFVDTPYPILFSIFPRDAPSRNSTDARGHLDLYDTTPGQQYVLGAVGYLNKPITFPEDSRQIYVLKRTE